MNANRYLAYLVVVHHQPHHLGRLIQALNHEDSVFFIHVDARAALAPFQSAVAGFDNVVFAPVRVAVEWGCFSVVQAILSLLQTAVATGHPFHSYTLLSGADYPIRHKQAIRRQLLSSDSQHMRIDRILTSDPANSHAHVIRDLPDGKYFGDMTPHHGSMFWSLTADCVRYVLDFVNRNPGFVDVHRYLFAPDEVFFQTLVKYSPFASAIAQDYSSGEYPDRVHYGNHFIDWERFVERGSLILDERDFLRLRQSKALFARKFDEEQSRILIGLLDASVHDPGGREEGR